MFTAENTVLKSVWAVAGYLPPSVYLYSALFPSGAAARSASASAVAVSVAWMFWVIAGDWRFAAGPLVLWILSAMFVNARRRMTDEESASFEAACEKLSVARAPSESELTAVSRDCAALAAELEKISGVFAAVKESLSKMDKSDIARRAAEIIMRMEGVRSVAVYDDALKLLAGDPGEEIRSAAFSSPRGDYAVLPALWGDRRFGVFAASGSWSSSAASAVYDVLSLFAVGYVRAALFEEYEAKSRRDPLTGLFNRRYFTTKLAMEVGRAARYGKTFALLMLDADHFKSINDTFGHTAGDAVLLKISSLLSDIGYPGAFAGRYGGEEFLVCLPFCGREECFRQAERLRILIAGAAFFDEKNNMLQWPVTVSVGGAVCPDDGASPAEIIAAADAMLYEAKNAGRNASRVKGVNFTEAKNES